VHPSSTALEHRFISWNVASAGTLRACGHSPAHLASCPSTPLATAPTHSKSEHTPCKHLSMQPLQLPSSPRSLYEISMRAPKFDGPAHCFISWIAAGMRALASASCFPARSPPSNKTDTFSVKIRCCKHILWRPLQFPRPPRAPVRDQHAWS
jgi:hypothetical protein